MLYSPILYDATFPLSPDAEARHCRSQISFYGFFFQVFSWTWYEPDRLVASTYYGGPMRSFGDYLYFGSINFPFSGALAHTANRQGPFDQRGGPMNAQADRGVVVVRARGLGGSAPKFELLYGEDSLPAFTGSGCVSSAERQGTLA